MSDSLNVRSGTYQDWSATAADTVAIAAAVNAAWSATQASQAASHAFIVEHGHQVLSGHGDTVGPAGSPPASDIGGVDGTELL